MPQNWDMGHIIYFPSEGRHTEDFPDSRKIQRLRPGLNPRTRVPVASMLTTRPPKPYVGSQYSHTTSKRGVSIITNADAHTSAASSRLNWLPRRFKWTRPFRRKTKSGFLRVCHQVPHELYIGVCIIGLVLRLAAWKIGIRGNTYFVISIQKLNLTTVQLHWPVLHFYLDSK